MTEHKKTSYGGIKDQSPLKPADKQKRKEGVFTSPVPSITLSIAEAVVIKNENLFFLTKADGSIPLEGKHGFGLYYHDCRYLDGYQVQIADADPTVLVSNADNGFAAVFELTNPEITGSMGETINLSEIGIKWRRILDAGRNALYEVFTFQNFSQRKVTFPFTLTYHADFEDVFAIRGLAPIQAGERREPAWEDGILSFVYDGADGLYRSLSIYFSPAPQKIEATSVEFQITLEPNEPRELSVSLIVAESAIAEQVKPRGEDQPGLRGIAEYFKQASEEWLQGWTEVNSNSTHLNRVMDRSLRDLRMLRMRLTKEDYFAAGVPWFVALFGRDSIITALQTLAFNPGLAADTLRLLARFQGQEVNQWRDEQPGKILHELRIGELARLGEIPHNPYYGTVDATPLFLILLASHASWTGDLALFHELREHIERALVWIDQYSDSDGDGFADYQSRLASGPVNQGWKDSGNAMVNHDGSLAEPPIALVEVQGYIYRAKMDLADLFERAGELERAEQLQQDARKLKDRFNQDFWLEDLGIYAMALQAHGKPVAVVSSNPGHALWAGIADRDKAEKTSRRLMAEDMFSGWGIRTLSANEKAYNPTAYHLGSVWPHDSSIIAAGFRQYRFDGYAERIFSGLSRASLHFESHRLPELFCGFPYQDYNVPIRYPVACHPQAWAAGSIPYLTTVFLGLKPEAFEHRLRIVRPMLPEDVDRIHVRGLKVGDASVDINFERASGDQTTVNVIALDGELDVLLEAEIKRKPSK
ncbi:MAG: amylo-alpha-1,6-glucosidase [Anaerolineales bacterium]|nr:amylo-alpha-1,6-glucosidase [Anaerolineales bacterium]